jgi:hypothetical protein
MIFTFCATFPFGLLGGSIVLMVLLETYLRSEPGLAQVTNNMVYQYHIKFLMHFTGKKVLNLPFYLYISLGKMVDKVQAKSNQIKHSMFHFGLIKLLVLEELKKTNKELYSFLSSIGFGMEVHGTPKTKKSTPVKSGKTMQSSSIIPKKTKKKDKEHIPATIETPEASTKTISRKESKENEKGKRPVEQVVRIIETVTETPDNRRVKEMQRKLELISEIVKLVKPNKPFTR